jgi:hypothetical protein
MKQLPDEKLRLAFAQVFVLSLFDVFDDYTRARQYIDVRIDCAI